MWFQPHFKQKCVIGSVVKFYESDFIVQSKERSSNHPDKNQALYTFIFKAVQIFFPYNRQMCNVLMFSKNQLSIQEKFNII